MEKIIENILEAVLAAIIFFFLLGKFQEFLILISSY